MNWSTCIDWLSFTMPSDTEIDRYPIWSSPKAEIHGLYGYACGVQTEEGVALFIHPTKPEMGIHVQYSGSALRNLAPLSPLHILTYHMGNGHIAKRVDIALDIFDAAITAGQIEYLWGAGLIKTRAKEATLIRENMGKRGEGFYVGSMRKRKKLLRCYNKAAQLRLDSDWFRFELQSSGTAAPSIAEELYTRGDNPDIVIGAIKGFANIPLPQFRLLFDVPGLKLPHRYEPQPDSSLDAAFRTIPIWVARLMHAYNPYVLTELLGRVCDEYHKLEPDWTLDIDTRYHKRDTSPATANAAIT